MEDMIVIALPKGQVDRLKAHILTTHGESVSLNVWISEAIEEKVRLEQARIDALPEGRKWYHSEEGREAIKRLKESRKQPE